MTSYCIKHNPHLIQFTAHVQQQFAIIYNTMFKSKLTIKLVPITFAIFAHTRVLATVLSSNECHSTNTWVT